MANSVDPDQTALGQAVCFFTLFVSNVRKFPDAFFLDALMVNFREERELVNVMCNLARISYFVHSQQL